MAIVTFAVLKPVALGLNVIVNVVLPLAAIGVAGVAVTVKSAACVPPIRTLGVPVRLRFEVKIRTKAINFHYL